ncbi:MAG: alkaline phosphatase family protein [Burkholderiales bacterium]
MSAPAVTSEQWVRPDYSGGGIVNLMASVTVARGGGRSTYPLLEGLDAEVLARPRTLVLLVIDGLGLRHVLRSSAAPCIREHLRGRMTSVFPSTTAAAIPTFLTALAPQQHGLTGWHMLFREVGTVAAVLPFRPRCGGRSLREGGVTPQLLLGLSPLYDRLTDRSWVIAPERIVHTDFNAAASGRAERVGYRTLDELAERVLAAAVMPARKFVYAYYPELDSLAHVHGIGSNEVQAELARIDGAFDSLVRALRGTDTTLVLTADHGFVDTTPETRVALQDHPELAAMLTLPLCGEPRVAYCYVEPERVRDFEHYAATRLAAGFTLVRSRDLIEEGWFGPGDPHPRLAERVGHYVLLGRDNWTLTDLALGERPHVQIGVHGGATADEMLVPLVVAPA